MKEKQIKIPGPDHPISIQRNPARVVVSVAGRVIADTRNCPDPSGSGLFRPSNTFHVKMSILLNWNGRITPPTVRIKATAVTTAFPLEEGSPSTRCGRMRIRILLLRRSRGTSRSIRTGSTR